MQAHRRVCGRAAIVVALLATFVVTAAVAAGAAPVQYQLGRVDVAGGPGATTTASAVATDPAGDVWVVGQIHGTSAFGSGAAPLSLTAVGPDDGFVARLDAAGQAQWVRRISGSAAGGVVAHVAVDAAGDATVVGTIKGTGTFDAGTAAPATVLPSTAGGQGFVARYDAAGAPVWVQAVAGAGSASVVGVAVRPDGGVAISGSFTGPVTVAQAIGSGDLTSTASEVFVATLDANGGFQWAQQGMGAPVASGRGIAVDAVGDVFVSGYFQGTLQLGSSQLVTTAASAAFVGRFDPAGTVVWLAANAGLGAALASTVTVDPAGVTVGLAGAFSGSIGWGVTALGARGGSDAFVAAVDGATGSPRWAQGIGGVGADAAFAATGDTAGRLYVAGSFSGTARLGTGGTVSLTGLGATSGFAARYGPTGGLEWATSVAGLAADESVAIALGSADQLVVAGSVTASAVIDADRNPVMVTSKGARDAFVARYVARLNAPPVAADPAVSTGVGTPVALTLAATDADGDPLTFAVSAPGPIHGSWRGTPPALTYTPVAAFVGTDSINFTVHDPYGGTATGTVTITVTGANLPPVARDLRTSTAPGRPEPIVLTGTDPNGDPLTYAMSAPGPSGGTVSGTAPNLVYTPTAGFRGADVFGYTVDDGHGGSAHATITVNVKEPNVVVITADDQTLEQQRFLVRTNALLGKGGTTFSNAVVSYSECCPSRATFLTGQYAHNHGVLSSAPPTGGVGKLDATNTLPVWLHANGYYTSLVGKYLNGYGVTIPASTVPPGWDDWYALHDPTTYNYFNYEISANGVPEAHGSAAADYSTDVLARHTNDVIRAHAGTPQPFFVDFTPVGPHVPPRGYSAIPAPRHVGTLPNAKAPRSLAFNEADVTDKPAFIQALPLLTPAQISSLDAAYERDAESLRSIDDAVAGLVDTLGQVGELDNTIVIFTSDNGFQYGEHRLAFGKSLPYEESNRVPLLVRGPGFPAGRIATQPVANVDLAATIASATITTPGRPLDGLALQPFAASATYGTARSILLEDGPLWGRSTYKAVRDNRYVYTVWSTGERELYDLKADPRQLQNQVKNPAYGLLALVLDGRLRTLSNCRASTCRMGV